jgi:hypothetical protein
MRTGLARAKEIEAAIDDLLNDITELETAAKALIGLHLGEELEVDASLGARQRVKFVTAAIISIT